MTRRADRLFAILQALRGGRLRTAEDLARDLEVSVRTIYRDIADLIGQGAPIDGERGVGYILRPHHFLPPLALTAEEMEALRWGVAFVRTHGDDALSKAAAELQAKIEDVSPARVGPAAFAARGARLDAKHKQWLARIREAIAESRKLALAYRDERGAETERVVRPLELEYWGAVWTLTAWCERREDFRAFRIDRMAACTLTDARFKPEPGKRLTDFFERLKAHEP